MTATFGGDLFLDAATASIPVAMNKLATSIQFEGLGTNLVKPVKVKATVSTPGNCPFPGAQGTVQFFDGDLLVGAQRVSNGSATIVISRPVGTRTLKASYLGDDLRNAGETSLVVNLQ